MRLLFVRHAESVANAEGRLAGREDYELTEPGRRQARALRDRLEAEGFRPTHRLLEPLHARGEDRADRLGPLVPADSGLGRPDGDGHRHILGADLG